MKKKTKAKSFLYVISIIALVFTAPSIAECQQWNVIQLDTLSFITDGGVITCDRMGNPYIFYFDHNTSTLIYAQYQEYDWIFESLNYNFKPRGAAIDSYDNIHLCATGLYDIQYLKITPDFTSYSIIADTTHPRFTDVGIAVDNYSNPHVSYCYNSNDFEYIYYAHLEESEWYYEEVGPVTVEQSKTALCLDNNNAAHIISQSPIDLLYLNNSSGNWEVDLINNNHEFWNSGFALKNNEIPSVLFCYDSAEYTSTLSYAELINDQWETTILGSNYDLQPYLSFEFDSFGNPHTLVSRDSLVYVYQDGSNWLFEPIGLSPGYIVLDLTIDLNNRLHAIILKTTMGGQGIYYCYNDIEVGIRNKNKGTAPRSFEINGIYPNPFNSNINLSLRLFKENYINVNIFGIDGSLIRKLWKGNHARGNYVISWNGKDDSNQRVCSGIYFLVVGSVNILSSNKIILLK